MMPALAVAIFAFTEAGTLAPPYSSAVPLFANVPTYVPALKVPSAAERTAAITEGSTPLATVPTNHLQSALSETQPLLSTHMTLWPTPANFAAAMEPRPTDPATGKTMSAFWEKKVVVSVLPAVWSVKFPTNVPLPLQVESEHAPAAGVQPRTFTDFLYVLS